MTEPAARRPQESPPRRVSSPRVLSETPAVKTGRGTQGHTREPAGARPTAPGAGAPGRVTGMWALCPGTLRPWADPVFEDGLWRECWPQGEAGRPGPSAGLTLAPCGRWALCWGGRRVSSAGLAAPRVQGLGRGLCRGGHSVTRALPTLRGPGVALVNQFHTCSWFSMGGLQGAWAGLGRAQQALWMEGKVLRADLAAPFTGPPTHPAWVRPTLEERSHAGGGWGRRTRTPGLDEPEPSA